MDTTAYLKQKHLEAAACVQLAEDQPEQRDYYISKYVSIVMDIIKKPLEKTLQDVNSNAVVIGDIVLAKPMNVVELADTIFKPYSTPNGYETN